MFKKINLILISFSMILSIYYNIGYTIIIPITIFYLLKDIKNIIYILLTTLFTIILFDFSIYSYLLNISLVTFVYLIVRYLIKKPVNVLSNKMLHLITYLLIFLLSFISNKYVSNFNLTNSIIYSIFSTSIYIFLEYLLISLFKNSNNNYSIHYLDIFNSLVISISLGTLNIRGINIGVIFSFVFAIILSKKYKGITSFIYSFVTMLFYLFVKDENIVYFLPIISSFNLLNNTYCLAAFNTFCIITIYTTDIYKTEYILLFMLISIIIELFSQFIDSFNKDIEKDYNLLEKNISKKISNDLTNVTFLFENIIKVFKKPLDYNKKLSNEINNIYNKYCDSCSKKSECFKLYNRKHFNLFKNAILNIESNDSFYSYCIKGEQINKYIGNIQNISDLEVSNKQNNDLIYSINCMNNCIKKINIELNNQNIIDLNIISSIIKRINYYGINIIDYKIHKYNVEDFLISLSVNKFDNNDFDIIESIFEKVLNKQVNIKQEIKNERCLYFIYPKQKIDIIYGYATLSNKNNFNGDNYFVKEISNTKLLIGLSDGMGKGYNAFLQSNKTLELVNAASNVNINLETSLDVINSFYNVQDYFEDFATLDLFYIDRVNSFADIYKMGASSSYILHSDNTFDKIINKSLPFGIDTEIIKETIPLKEGDLIFISSDGIFENIQNEEDLLNYLLSIKEDAPKQIAYSIIDYTIKQKTLTKDDMSVIVVKVKE